MCDIVLCLLNRDGVEGRVIERKFWVSESWIELLLAVTHAFLAISPLAYLGWPLTRAALSRASSAISWNPGNCFKGSQPRQFS